MYSQQILRARIKYLCECKNITLKNMLSDLEYGVNLLTQTTGDRGLSGVALYKIADYLDVSVDYLLGRTHNPEVNR